MAIAPTRVIARLAGEPGRKHERPSRRRIEKIDAAGKTAWPLFPDGGKSHYVVYPWLTARLRKIL
jgi:hypothetical protein